MKRFMLLTLVWLFGVSAGIAQPDFDFDDCDCPLEGMAPVCAELAPGIVIALPNACFADCMGLELVEGGDCAVGWEGNGWDDDGWDDDDDDDWDDDDDDNDDWDDDNDDWGNWDDDDFDWSDSTWTGDWDDDDFDWSDSTWTGDWNDDFDWSDSTWTDGPDFPGGGWTDSIDLGGDLDFDLLDSLLNDWLANGGQDLVDSLLNGMANGDTLVFPPFPGDLNLDSLLAGGDFSWLDSLLVGGGWGGFPWDDPGFPGGDLDSLISGGFTGNGLGFDLDGMWLEKGPGEEEFENFGTVNNRGGSAIEQSATAFQCYPVPASERLFVQVTGQATRLELWSLTGQRLQHVNLTSTGAVAFDVAHLANGTYLMRMQDEHGIWSQKTLIIQH